MLHPFLPMADSPESYYHYFPTWEEWAITIGSLAGALLLITLMARIFPVVPVQETIKEKQIEPLKENFKKTVQREIESTAI